jgi:gas vesicle protein
MNKNRVPFSVEEEDLEFASIFADVALKKGGEKKFGIFKATPEEIEFISKLYLPFYACPMGNDTLFLSASFFERVVKDFGIPREGIDEIILQAERNGISPEELTNIEKYMGAYGVLGKLTGKKKENYVEHVINGGYPNNFPNTLLEEFSFIKSTHLFKSAEEEDGIIFPPNLTESELNNSVKKISELLSQIDSDNKYLAIIEAKITNIVGERVNTLKIEKARVNEHFEPIYGETKSDAIESIGDIENQISNELSELDDDFKNRIYNLAEYYSPLYKAISDPSSCGGGMDLFDAIGAWVDIFKYISAILNREPEYKEAAIDLKGKIRAARSIANSIEGEGEDTKEFKDTIKSVCKYAEDSLNDVVNTGNREIKREWSKVEAISEVWKEEIDKLDNEINKLITGNEKANKKINNIISEKREVMGDIMKNTMISDITVDGYVYLTFYVASLIKKDKRRFFVYAPAIKKDKRGLSLKGYVYPFNSISEGVKKLGSIIGEKVIKDEEIQEKVVSNGLKYNLLKNGDIEKEIREGLVQLKDNGWIKDKQCSMVIGVLK